MNLFDRVRLLIRSTVSGALRGNLPEIPSSERGEKLMDKAQARIEMLNQDLARAEKRGDAELASRLKREINDLQATLDKARKRIGQPMQPSRPASASTTPAQSTSQTETKAQQEQSGEVLDNSRMADQIRKMREDRHDIGNERATDSD